ncbi:MAG: hypothetical protein LBD37_09115 [Treponema sp.]|jgi:hypothetical protein|nr:hypothetical protein [Treponema sp.]
MSGGLAVWRSGGLAVWRSGGLAVWRSGGLAVWLGEVRPGKRFTDNNKKSSQRFIKNHFSKSAGYKHTPDRVFGQARNPRIANLRFYADFHRSAVFSYQKSVKISVNPRNPRSLVKKVHGLPRIFTDGKSFVTGNP